MEVRHASASETSTGTREYSFLCRLAHGGMGEVELAMRVEGHFRRLYAVKRLLPAHRHDAAFRAAFLDEARVAGLIRHPNVVSVHDVGEDDRGPYLVMDYVEGVSCSRIVRHANRSERRVPLQIALRLVSQAAKGLYAAHRLAGPDGQLLRVVHRDVTPQNILVGVDGLVRVTDFGIAKAYGRVGKTTADVLKGKIGYMSPEQLRFEDVEARSDLFSLGIVLYELLAGTRLYRSESKAEVARAILHAPAPDLGEVRGDVPPSLVDLAFRLLAKSPSDRPEDARAVARILDSLINECVATEGPLELDEYIAEEFGEEIDKRSRELEEVVRSRSSVVSTPIAAESGPGDGGFSSRASWRSKRWLVAVAVVVAGAAVGGVAALTSFEVPESASGRSDRRSDRRTVSPAPTPTAVEPIVGAPTMAETRLEDDVRPHDSGRDSSSREIVSDEGSAVSNDDPVSSVRQVRSTKRRASGRVRRRNLADTTSRPKDRAALPEVPVWKLE